MSEKDQPTEAPPNNEAAADPRASVCSHAGGEPKVIQEASLCLRFYRSAGWTREQVRQLLGTDQRIDRVMPRYFDARDDLVKAMKDRFELHDDAPHDDCDYFAVYNPGQPFDRAKLARHTVNPFAM